MDASIIMIDDSNRSKAGRGYTKYCYTVKDVARVAGRSIGTVRNDMSAGRVDLASLWSVSYYIARYAERAECA